MEFLIELLLDLFVEGSIEALSNKKLPKWIKYILAFIIILLFLTLTIGLIVLGIILLNDSILGGMFLIIIGIVLLMFSISKFAKVKKQMNN